MEKREDFLDIVSSFIRVSNLAKAESSQVNTELLSEAEENYYTILISMLVMYLMKQW